MLITVLDEERLKYFDELYDAEMAESMIQGTKFAVGALYDQGQHIVPCGLIVADINGGLVSIDWIYVAPEYRRHHIATKLMDILMKSVYEAEGQEVYLTFKQNADGLNEFLNTFGFSVMYNDGWHSYNASLEDFVDIPNEKEDDGLTIQPLMTVPDEMLNSFSIMLMDFGTNVCIEVPLDSRDFSPFSLCSIKDNRVTGILLAEVDETGEKPHINFPWVYINDNSIKVMPRLYNTMISMLKEYYHNDAVVTFESLSTNMDRIISKVAPNAKFEEVYMATWVVA